jgi:hypothetical protein
LYMSCTSRYCAKCAAGPIVKFKYASNYKCFCFMHVIYRMNIYKYLCRRKLKNFINETHVHRNSQISELSSLISTVQMLYFALYTSITIFFMHTHALIKWVWIAVTLNLYSGAKLSTILTEALRCIHKPTECLLKSLCPSISPYTLKNLRMENQFR